MAYWVSSACRGFHDRFMDVPRLSWCSVGFELRVQDLASS